ncbi:hypothetical protein F5Y06DRAFT_304768 [Hypoxylon sp. FL0890]|nr:hypothetical protein F5Y06DRAFT_304768 [Hypoxylon sp. FL0890]
MSGIEVAGIVLGSIPLVISALEHYGEILQAINRWRFTAREIQSLTRRLGTQQAIFTNTCEHLLSGIVPATRLEEMIAEPFGPLWQDQDIKDKIELRLDRVMEPFGDTAKTMVEAVEQFKSRLDLDENGQVKWIEANAIVRELKRATFTIKRSHYDDLLDILAEGNQDLKTLTKQSLQLEPGRNARHQGRLLVLLRDISGSVYNAISNSFQCSCSTTHGISLQMTTPSLSSTDKDEQVLHNAVFRCVFSYSPNQQDSGADKRWQKVLLKLDESKKSEQNKPNTTQHHHHHTPPSTPKPPKSAVRLKTSDRFREGVKSVKFAMTSTFGSNTTVQTSTITQTQTTSNPTIMLSTAAPRPTTAVPRDTAKTTNTVNICHIIRKQGKSPYVPCYGYIADQSTQEISKFGVYPPEPPEDYDSVTWVSMKSMLEDKGSNFPQISYLQRMKLAVDISSSVLQLNGTPWLPEILTSEDIFFMNRDQAPLYNQAFVARGALFMAIPQATPGPPTPIQSRSCISSQSLFALGILLVELLLLKPLDHVWTPNCNITKGHAKTVDQITDWKGIKDILDQVQVMAGSNYYSAVRRFLFYDFTNVNTVLPNDEVLYKEIYGKTIALLVEDRSLSQF